MIPKSQVYKVLTLYEQGTTLRGISLCVGINRGTVTSIIKDPIHYLEKKKKREDGIGSFLDIETSICPNCNCRVHMPIGERLCVACQARECDSPKRPERPNLGPPTLELSEEDRERYKRLKSRGGIPV